jgi:hypothetical protein
MLESLSSSYFTYLLATFTTGASLLTYYVPGNLGNSTFTGTVFRFPPPTSNLTGTESSFLGYSILTGIDSSFYIYSVGKLFEKISLILIIPASFRFRSAFEDRFR